MVFYAQSTAVRLYQGEEKREREREREREMRERGEMREREREREEREREREEEEEEEEREKTKEKEKQKSFQNVAECSPISSAVTIFSHGFVARRSKENIQTNSSLT